MNIEVEALPLEGSYYKVVPCEGASILAVVFANVNMPAGKYTFFKNMEQQPVHRLYVNDVDNRWYQNGVPGLGSNVEDSIEMILKWKDQLGADEIVTVGSSMGGYGAILFGAKLGCRVLAFGAETILKLPQSRSLTFMPKSLPVLYPDLKPIVLESDASITLISGEFDLVDLIGAKNLYELKNTEVISIRGIGHNTPAFLDSKYGIGDIFKSYLLDDKLPDIEDKGTICGFENAVELLGKANNEFLTKQYELAKNTLNEIIEISNTIDIAYFKLGNTLYLLQDYEGAVKSLENAVRISPHFVKAYEQLGVTLRKLGRFEEAFESHVKAYENDPYLPTAYFNAGLALEKLKRFDEAEAHFRKAVNLAEENPKFKKKLADTLLINANRRIKEYSEIVNSLLVNKI
ncbi:tetratricopeptide repeat protein [Neobacillus niacini]|uniref:tetratricopeptide repeat protein n=1 Tax=Neobacillus niacini TaxID=86668 RepID=UPI0030007573